MPLSQHACESAVSAVINKIISQSNSGSKSPDAKSHYEDRPMEQDELSLEDLLVPCDQETAEYEERAH